MPELPEVETIRRSLAPFCEGRAITRVIIHTAAVLANCKPDDFTHALSGHTICTMGRRGKYLLFFLDNHATVVLHLRMTGQLYLDDGKEDDHCHALIELDDGHALRYRDVRKFGRFWYYGPGEDYGQCGLGTLGPEPMDAEFTLEYLQTGLRRHTCPIKNRLLDQHFIAGIGNIYADETLFAAGLHPLRTANSLSRREIVLLREQTIAVLQQAIACHGTTFRDYRDGFRAKGMFGEKLQVFGRGGERCYRCGTIIEKLRCGNRGTSFCPHCQPLYPRRVIGLTGGIASGKTYCSEILRQKGAEIIDCDIISREVVTPGQPALNAVAARFDHILHDDGTLDRAALRARIFGDETERRALNAILMPAIKAEINRQLSQSTAPVCILVAPLLFEAGLDGLCDEVWVVDCAESKQHRRLMRRDHIDAGLARAMIAAQLNREQRLARADRVIDNSATRQYAQKQLVTYYESITADSATKNNLHIESCHCHCNPQR